MLYELTSTQFLKCLMTMPDVTYRRALLFSLEAQIELTDLEFVTRGQAKKMNLNSVAQKLFANTKPSEQTNLLFWKEQGDDHVGLSDMRDVIFASFNMTWCNVVKSYQNLKAQGNKLVFS